MVASCDFHLRLEPGYTTTFSPSFDSLEFPITVASLFSLLLNPPATPGYWCPTVQYVDEALSLYYQLVDFRLIWNQDYESIIPPSGDFHVPFRLRDGLDYALIQRARLRISCEALQPLQLALDLPLQFEGMTRLKKFNLIYEMTK